MSALLFRIAFVLSLNTVLVSCTRLLGHQLLTAQHRYNQLHNDLRTTVADMKPCCYPKKWQGDWYREISMADVEFGIQWYEDDTTKNIALNITGTSANGTVVQQVGQIATYDTKLGSMVVYSFEESKKQCQSEAVNETFDQLAQQCMPADAFFFGMVTMGIPKGGANLNVYSFMWKPDPDQAPDLHYERIVTVDCAPVLGILRGALGDQTILQSDYYFNIQTSITDPSVFTVPNYCKPPAHQSKVSPVKLGLLGTLNQKFIRTVLHL